MIRPLPQIMLSPPPAALRPRAVVVVLVGADPALLGRCLGALARQRSAAGLRLAPEAFGVVVAPAAEAGPLHPVVQALRPVLPFPILPVTVRLRPVAGTVAAEAAWAMRAAMADAADWLGGDGPVLVTDAAIVPEPIWVAQGFAALAGPAEAVLGAVMAPGGGSNAAARYAGLLAALAALLDPGSPAEDSAADAASFGIRAGTLAALGGLPAGPGGGLPGLLAALARWMRGSCTGPGCGWRRSGPWCRSSRRWPRTAAWSCGGPCANSGRRAPAPTHRRRRPSAASPPASGCRPARLAWP